MTTPRRSQMVVADPTTLATSTKFLRQNGRGATVSETALGTIGSVVPWPYTVDSNGESFPGSGLLGVTWANTSYIDATFNPTLIAVPDTMPSGYVFRGEREVGRGGYGQSSSRGMFTPFSLSAYSGAYCTGWLSDGAALNQAPRLRSSTALISYPFFPENLANNAFHFNSVSRDGPGAALMGLRYIKSRVVYTGIFDPVYYDYGQFQIVRYTDPATLLFPDSATGLFPVDATVWTSPHITADYNTGFLYDVTDANFKAPAGTRCYWASLFTLHTAATNPADPPNIWRNPTTPLVSAVEHWWGPRLDIPFPFTVCGENSIAPGGIVTGYLPGY